MDNLVRENENFAWYETKYGVGYVVSKKTFFKLGKNMPCMCWYTPGNADQKHFKDLCVQLVDLIKRLEKDGDPTSCTLNDAHKLLNHLYRPESCDEKD